MSIFGDYKAYRKYEPSYLPWKNNRDLQEAKRIEYLRQNPDKINNDDIQRGKALLRSIDIMDEYSQKRAEDMEIATNTVVSYGLELAFLGGTAIGFLLSAMKPVSTFLSRFIKNSKQAPFAKTAFSMGIGIIATTVAGFPLYAWAAKTEVGASRKGRFEAMRKELKNPNGFAVLTNKQYQQAQQIASQMPLSPKDNGYKTNIFKIYHNLKNMVMKDNEYKTQRQRFELELENDNKHINENMSEKEILNAKKDQQLLTKLVEKIDIASQDYAENAELASNTLFATLMTGTVLVDLGVTKLLKALKVKSARTISTSIKGVGIGLTLLSAILSANISKEASRIGRYKVKKELMQHPEQLVYVDDKDIAHIKDVNVPEPKKQSFFNFIKNIYNDLQEYNKYKKNGAQEEKRFYKALEKIELTPEQLKDAKRLQKNTFRTFNKVDENSQKYSESIEALGQAVAQPLLLICSTIGMAFAFPFLTKKTTTSAQQAENITKYIGTIFLSTLPAIIIDGIITKKQKKASRIADMQAINDMSDYRQFK